MSLLSLSFSIDIFAWDSYHAYFYIYDSLRNTMLWVPITQLKSWNVASVYEPLCAWLFIYFIC